VYHPRTAVDWGLRHAKTRQPFIRSCALFISKTLWAGGLPQTDEWNDRGWRGDIPGTPTATVCRLLVTYLTTKGYADALTVFDDKNQPETLPQARIGDSLLFDWGDDYLHMAVITVMRDGVLPLVSEWGTARKTGNVCPYLYRPWLWSENAQRPLLEVYPRQKITLLRMT